MATPSGIPTPIGNADSSAYLITWNLTTADNVGAALEMPEWADRTVQAFGTNWGGATLAIEGSNDGTNWVSLKSVATAAAIALTADGIVLLLELPRYIRPKLTTAGTAAVIAVTAAIRRPTPMRT